MKTQQWRYYLSLGATTFSIFIYEILLSRIFSVLYIYKILFLIISLAILGIGIGSFIYELYLQKKNQQILPNWFWIGFSLSFFISLVLLIKFYYVLTLYVCIILTSIPFIFGGVAISFFYSNLPEKSNVLYLSDLLGGVFGCILSMLFVYLIGVINTIILCSIFIFLPLFVIYQDKKDKITALIISSFIIIFLIMNINNQFLNLEYEQLKHADTPLGYALTYPKMPAQLLESRWDIYSRCDLVKISRQDKRRAIFINGGTQAIMLRYKDENSAKKDFSKDITGFPYQIGANQDVLILGSGGGRDVRMALLNSAKKVTAVEINKSVVDMTRENKEYNGGIYDDPRVNLIIEDGRSFIMHDNAKYDQIVLSLATTHAFSDINSIAQFENYLFTNEAFNEYFNHLKENGMLVFFVDYEQIMKKFVFSALQYFENNGMQQTEAVNHILALSSGSKWSAYSYVLVIGKKSFGFNVSGRLIARAEDIGLEPVIFPHSSTGTDFDDIIKGNISIKNYIKRYPYNIASSTDDNPYFMEVIMNYRNKLIIFVSIIFLSLVIIICGVVFFRNKYLKNQVSSNEILPQKYFLLFTLYFFNIGVGFMLIEIALIKRLSFYFSYPEFNLSILLSIILLSSGIGAYISKFRNNKNDRKSNIIYISSGCAVNRHNVKNKILLSEREVPSRFCRRVASLLITAIFLTSWSMTFFISKTIHLNILTKSIFAGLFLFPICFLMGMFLPLGMQLVREKINVYSNFLGKNDIPWYLGINGIASVIGSVLAVVLSMFYGFSLAFMLAGILYGATGIIAIVVSENSVIKL